MEKINLLGIDICTGSLDQVVYWSAEQIVRSGRGVKHIVTLNPEIISMALKSPVYRDLINQADLVIPDGVGLQMAADFLAMDVRDDFVLRELMLIWNGSKVAFKGISGRFEKIPHRVTGVDLFYQLIQKGKKNKWRYYLLGGGSGVAKRASKELSHSLGINVVGAESGGEIDNRGVGRYDKEVIKRINESKAEILLVSFGAPRQEFWINRYREDFSHLKIAIGGGATLDFVVGLQKRAPILFQRLAIEWLWRLMLEPGRFKRILKAFPVFPLNVALYKYYMVKSS